MVVTVHVTEISSIFCELLLSNKGIHPIRTFIHRFGKGFAVFEITYVYKTVAVRFL